MAVLNSIIMDNAEEKIYKEALAAIEEGNNLRAKDLLTRLLKMNQQNPEYWLWMSAVVQNTKERRYCLNQVLQYDPQNSDARRGLILLGDLPQDDSLRLPVAQQQRKWVLPESAGLETEKIKMPWLRLGLGLLAVIILIVIFSFALSSNRLWIFRNRQVAVLGTAQSTPTFPATKTPTITPTIQYVGPTPPWMALAETYTPTPLYVNTPHAIIEAYQIAIRRFQKAEWAQAIQYFQQAIQTDNTAPDLQFLLGEAYRQNGQLSQAVEAFNKAIQIDPNFAPSYLGRARIGLMAKPDSYEGIIPDLQKSIQLDPKMGEAYLELANIQISMNEWEDAEKNLESAALYLPDSPLISIARGKFYLQAGDFNSAIEYALLANQQDQTILETYRFLGQAYQAAGRMVDSLDPLLVFTLHSKEEDPQAIAWLGSAYAAAGNTEEAIKQFDRAIKIDRFSVDIYMQRGQLYYSSSEFEAALEDFSTALKIQPKLYEACMMIGETQLKLQQPGNAYIQLSECQKMAENDQQSGRLFFYRALALEELGNEVALDDWERLFSLPEESLQPEWVATANAYLSLRFSPTPSSTKSTSTIPSPVVTNTSTTTPKTSTPTPKPN